MIVYNLMNNQTVVKERGVTKFYSYGSLVAKEHRDGSISISKKYWAYSKTTLKWLKVFLGLEDYSKKELKECLNKSKYKFVGDLK